MKHLVVLVLLSLGTVAQAADVLYVDDKLLVSLRTGQGNGYRSVSTIESGTRLEILETSGDYVLARDPKGNEGWVRHAYLTEQPVARDRLIVAETRIAALEADKQKLRDQVAEIKTDRSEISKNRSQLEKDNQRLTQELAELRESAANPLKLAAENKEMSDRLATLDDEAQRLRVENERLQNDTAREWALTGAGVLLGGMLIGMYIHKLRRRRSSWSNDF